MGTQAVPAKEEEVSIIEEPVTEESAEVSEEKLPSGEFDVVEYTFGTGQRGPRRWGASSIL